VDDSFYTIFLGTGTHTVTATHSGGYAPDVATVTTVQSGTIGHDFYLDAGKLDFTPESLSAVLELGMSITRPFTISNDGLVSTLFELDEIDDGSVPLAPVSGISSDSTRNTVDIPWLTEEPVSNTIAGGLSRSVTVTFDANTVTQPGVYRARIHIQEDTPYEMADVRSDAVQLRTHGAS